MTEEYKAALYHPETTTIPLTEIEVDDVPLNSEQLEEEGFVAPYKNVSKLPESEEILRELEEDCSIETFAYLELDEDLSVPARLTQSKQLYEDSDYIPSSSIISETYLVVSDNPEKTWRSYLNSIHKPVVDLELPRNQLVKAD